MYHVPTIGTMNKTIGSKKYRELVQYLKAVRLEADLTMRDLGALIDEPHTFVHKIEALERKLDVYEYVQYCKALNLDPEIGMKILIK